MTNSEGTEDLDGLGSAGARLCVDELGKAGRAGARHSAESAGTDGADGVSGVCLGGVRTGFCAESTGAAKCAELYAATRRAVSELIAAATKPFYSPKLIVIGCSSSEALGGLIGHDSSPKAGAAIARGALDAASERGIFLAVQCCEHLNRALVIERAAAEKFGYQEVWAVPQPKAGGSFATGAWQLMSEPVLVEEVKADAGLDIGDTFIGMHLRRVAVPVRLKCGNIGLAHVTAALCRPPLIGGERAHYE